MPHDVWEWYCWRTKHMRTAEALQREENRERAKELAAKPPGATAGWRQQR